MLQTSAVIGAISRSRLPVAAAIAALALGCLLASCGGSSPSGESAAPSTDSSDAPVARDPEYKFKRHDDGDDDNRRRTGARRRIVRGVDDEKDPIIATPVLVDEFEAPAEFLEDPPPRPAVEPPEDDPEDPLAPDPQEPTVAVAPEPALPAPATPSPTPSPTPAPAAVNLPPGVSAASAGDVVINEIHYHPVSDDPADEWIELFNRSNRSVSLAGWKLAGEVDLEFDGSAVIPAGGYAVIAASKAKIAGGLGKTLVLGDWTGRLDNKGGSLKLLTPSGETAERVKYSSKPPFPARADGLGSSLERRDPNVDGAFGGNWGASRSSAEGASWTKVQVTGFATSTRLYIYLLGAGTAYVDDIRFAQAFSTTGGTSSLEEDASAWRFSGNHGLSQITTENAASGRFALRVQGTAAGSDRSDSAYLTVPGLRPGQSYTLQCKVLFETPNVPLIFRLSNSRKGQGIYAETAAAGGSLFSPGAKNSIQTTTLPPFIADLSHEPERPGARDKIEIIAEIASAAALDSAKLWVAPWTGDGFGAAKSFDLEPRGGATAAGKTPDEGVISALKPGPAAREYAASVGPFPPRTLLRYWVSARDESRVEARYPAADSPTKAHGVFVEDPRIKSELPVYQIFIPSSSMQTLDRNVYTDVYQEITFVYDGKVSCDAGFRYRGQTSRRYPKKQLKIRLNSDHSYRPPVPGHAKIRTINLKSAYVDKIFMRETLGFDLFRDTGEPYCETFFVRAYMNGEYLGLYVQVENPNSGYMKRNRLEAGWLWKSYATGHGEGRTRGQSGIPVMNRPTEYGGISGFELKVGDPDTGADRLREFLRKINELHGPPLEAYIRENMDVESFVNYLAACQVMHNADHLQKNHLVYANPEGKFTFLAWDLDLTHGRNYECRSSGILNDVVRHDMWDDEFNDDRLLYGTYMHPKCDDFWNGVINAFLAKTDAFRPAYYKRIAELLQTQYHPKILLPKALGYRELIKDEVRLDRQRWGAYGRDTDFDRRFALFARWIDQRYDHLERKLSRLGYKVGNPINAYFEAESREGRAPFKMRFKSLAYGSIRKHAWDFGDGSTSSDKNPTHTYEKPGLYAVKLKVEGRDGEHEVLFTDYVHVKKPLKSEEPPPGG